MSSKRKQKFFVTAVCAACVVTTAGATVWAGAPKCPPGERPSLSGCRSSAPQLRSTAKPAEAHGPGATGTAERPEPKRPPVPDASLRPTSTLERANRRLLVEEITRLERLVQATRPKSPDRAQLLLRIAGAYAELAAAAERDHIRLEIQIEKMEREQHARDAAEKKAPPPPIASPPTRGVM